MVDPVSAVAVTDQTARTRTGSIREWKECEGMSTLVDSFSREDWRSIPGNISSVCLTSLRDEKSVLEPAEG